MIKDIYKYAHVYGFADIYKEKGALYPIYLIVKFNDSPREQYLKIYKDKIGKYVIHKREKYYYWMWGKEE